MFVVLRIYAEREGFEPSIHFRVYTLSRRASSATRAPLQNQWAKVQNYSICKHI